MIKQDLQNALSMTIKELYGLEIAASDLLVVPTKKEYKGDFTLTVFPIAGKVKKAPPVASKEIGDRMVTKGDILSYEVVQGFLNMELNRQSWIHALTNIYNDNSFGHGAPKDQTVLVEYCSPNTNKPLHLGHIRNMLLGSSTARILEVLGYNVKRIQVINDRGIAICKSMLAWQKWAHGATPESTHIKGDHFVGDYYVLFERHFREEYTSWQSGPEAEKEFSQRKDLSTAKEDFFSEYKNVYFNKFSPLGKEAREMLLSWEANDPEVKALWAKMNQWVYKGFEETCNKLGVYFDSSDYESVTYLLGKDAVEKGLSKGIFYKKEDGSAWINLEDAGMDQKLVLRSDGTSIYITQDFGTAQMRYEKYHMDKCIYVVANEQDYHFKVLFEILKRFKEPYAGGLYHLSYGMVELPEGKMKSREGTVVDADDLIDEVISEAKANASERGELNGLSSEDQNKIIESIALGAIKFFMLKVNPKKGMVFNPKESVDLQGQTGPYIQNAFVRIQSVLRKSNSFDASLIHEYKNILPEEKELLILVETYPSVVNKAGTEYDPSEIANYAYALAKAFHKFYHEVPILRADDPAALQFRLTLSKVVGNTLREAFDLLGISMPERM